MQTDFDQIAQNCAELIDATFNAQRPRARRIELIRHAVKRAIVIGYRTGKISGATPTQQQNAHPHNRPQMAPEPATICSGTVRAGARRQA